MLSSSSSTVRISGFAESTSTRAIALYIHKTIYKRFRVTYDLRKDIAITVLILLFAMGKGVEQSYQRITKMIQIISK